jgi:hypothetical protein
MNRLRAGLGVAAIVLTLGVGPAAAQETTTTVEGGAAVVVQDPATPPAEDAWTFRFLVPTVLATSGLALVATALGYRARRRRYRLVR